MSSDPEKRKSSRASRRKIRYAVVGLGHIAQTAVLPAFAHARRNSELVALVSDDHAKLTELADRHHVPHRFHTYDDCLASGEVDAVYIALPNHLHCEFTVRAAEAGVHVLCEKPMAVTTAECEKMNHAVEAAGVKLMIAYRLHFEEANLRAIKIAQSGAIGELRAFSSIFAINVDEGNVRLEQEFGGGTLYDIGVYCINAARYLFRDEPLEVTAFSANNGEPRFAETDEMTGAILRFPLDRLASFLVSFGVSEVGAYQILGTEGNLRVDPAYDYASKLTHYLTVGGKTTKRSFARRDQFAPELTYFSDCIRKDKQPEPSGREGLLDVQIIEALYESARQRIPIRLQLPGKWERPSLAQESHAPPVREPELVHAAAPQDES
jgi:glucose-fructose oxidoreductase